MMSQRELNIICGILGAALAVPALIFLVHGIWRGEQRRRRFAKLRAAAQTGALVLLGMLLDACGYGLERTDWRPAVGVLFFAGGCVLFGVAARGTRRDFKHWGRGNGA